MRSSSVVAALAAVAAGVEDVDSDHKNTHGMHGTCFVRQKN